MNTIICAVGKAHANDDTIATALRLATSVGAHVLLAHVHEDDNATTVARAALEHVDPALHGECVDISGDIATGLARLAADRNAVAIVVGARRRGRSGTVYRSRTMGQLQRHTDIPVLMASGAGTAAPMHPTSDPQTADHAPRRSKLRPAKHARRAWANTSGQLRPRPAHRS